jgi:D-glycero-alpha-D-manno-heptose 1-phosphate guanylyltransferase
MQAIVLAGGFGTRLKTVVADKPKALSLVAGNPFLYYVIEHLRKEGITDFIFSLGYLSEQIVSFLNNCYPDLSYKYCVETSPLGTGGGIKKALELATEKDVLIVNADTFFEVDISLMMQVHRKAQANCTIALKAMTDFDRYGTVAIDAEKNIVSFKEKTYTQSGLINGGYLILDKGFFEVTTAHLSDVFGYEKDFLEPNLEKMTIKGFISNGYFIDIGIPEDYLEAQKVFKNFPLTAGN